MYNILSIGRASVFVMPCWLQFLGSLKSCCKFSWDLQSNSQHPGSIWKLGKKKDTDCNHLFPKCFPWKYFVWPMLFQLYRPHNEVEKSENNFVWSYFIVQNHDLHILIGWDGVWRNYEKCGLTVFYLLVKFRQKFKK